MMITRSKDRIIKYVFNNKDDNMVSSCACGISNILLSNIKEQMHITYNITSLVDIDFVRSI